MEFAALYPSPARCPGERTWVGALERLALGSPRDVSSRGGTVCPSEAMFKTPAWQPQSPRGGSHPPRLRKGGSGRGFRKNERFRPARLLDVRSAASIVALGI